LKHNRIKWRTPEPWLHRYSQLDLAETKWYHVVSRCVRRAFLCGVDNNSGKSYEHRRHWVEARMKYLASIFTVDIAAFAIHPVK
jgi:hypothetical protein